MKGTERGQEREQTIDTKQAIGAISDVLNDWTRLYGQDAVKEFVEKLHQALAEGTIPKPGELEKVFENRPDRFAFQEAALKWLEKDGVISWEGKTMIVDLPALRNIDWHYWSKRRLPGKETYAPSRREMLGNIFAGRKAISREDWKQGVREAKDVFYLPETADEAFDPERIRQSDFYLGLWEIPSFSKEQSLPAMEQPAAIERLGMFETTLAAVMYHPRFGDARRTPTGRLLVRQGETYKPLTGEWFATIPGLQFSSEGTKGVMQYRPYETVRQFAPELLGRGLLHESDIGTKHSEVKIVKEATKVASPGLIGFEGVRYNPGREFIGRNIRLERLGEGIGAVVEVDEQNIGTLVATFRLFKKGDPELMERKTNSGKYWEALKATTGVQPFHREDYLRRRPDESDGAYRERLKDLEQFEKFLRFDNELKHSTAVRTRSLPPDVFKRLRLHPEAFSHERETIDFLRLTESRGLEALARVANSPGVSEQLIRVGMTVPAERRSYFLASIIVAAKAKDETLAAMNEALHENRITDLEYRKTLFELNRRLASMIVSAEDLAKSQEAAVGAKVLIRKHAFEHSRSDIILFSKMFKDAFKGAGETVPIETLRGLEFRLADPSSIAPGEQQEMLAIFEENWRDQDPTAAKAFRKMLEDKLQATNGQTHFYLLKKDGEIGAFVRFDHRDDLESGAYYAGSLNIAPSLRGSAIGEAFMKNTLEKEAQEHVLYAHVVPDAIVATHYVEGGFVITGVDKVKVGKEETQELAIRWDAAKNTHYRARQKGMTHERLLQELPGVRVSRFSYPKEKAAFLSAIQQAEQSGEVMTRYWHDPKDPSIRYAAFESDVPVEERVDAAA